jgi:hypothetical protein
MVSGSALIGATLHPHHRGWIAGAGLAASLAWDGLLAHLHIRKKGS